jgi:voltage-gated potassium channel
LWRMPLPISDGGIEPPLPPGVPTAAHGPRSRHSLFGGLMFTILLLGSIALAIRQSYPMIAVAVVGAVLLMIVIFHYVIRASGFFGVVFANAVGVYTCIYIVFVSSNFPAASGPSLSLGFLLPLTGFAAGVVAQRKHLHSLVSEAPRHRAAALRGSALWIGPLMAIALATSFMRIPSWSPMSQDAALMMSMFVVSVVAWRASRRISLFLLDTGVVFRAFFANAVKLVQPAFALLTCYSLVIIFFGSAFTVFDQMSLAPNFSTLGQATLMTFPEGLYLSVATLTMVGYGDITPLSSMARLLVSIELICGVILLLFGVEAMLQRGNRAP